MLFWGHSLVIVKCDWGNFFPTIEEWLTPTIKNKKVTYSNASLKLWTERKRVIELTPVKSYKKDPVFLEAKTL